MSPAAVWIKQKVRFKDGQGALAAMLLVLAVLGVFSGTLRNGFTWWDDQSTIHQNPNFNPPSGAGILHYWKTPAAGLYVPVTYSYWGALAYVSEMPAPDEQGVHLSARMYHAGSVGLHLASVLVVFAILRMLCGNVWASCGGALLFAVHPVQVEPVAWASGAKDVLFGLLSLCAVHQYLLFARSRRKTLTPTLSHTREDPPADQLNRPREGEGAKAWRYYVTGAVMLVLAMLAKPSAMVVPVVVAALDLLIVRRKVRMVAVSAGVWMLLCAPLALVAKTVQTAAGVADVSGWHKPLIALDAITFYLWKLIAPVNLAPDYGRRPAAVLEILGGKWLYFAWIIPAAIAAILHLRRKTQPWLAAAAIVFVAVLLPVLGFVPFMFQYTSTVADHYLYLAMLGPALALCWLLVRYNTIAIKACCGAALACFAFLSIQQARIWQDDVTLWTHNLAAAPRTFLAPNNLASALGRQSRYLADLADEARQAGNTKLADELGAQRRELLERAIVNLERSIAVHPNFVTARHNLWVYELRLGHTERAVEHLEAMLRANEIAPPHMRENFTTFHDTAGHLWARLGNFEKAGEHFAELLRRAPQHATAAHNLAMAKRKLAEARADPGD